VHWLRGVQPVAPLCGGTNLHHVSAAVLHLATARREEARQRERHVQRPRALAAGAAPRVRAAAPQARASCAQAVRKEDLAEVFELRHASARTTAHARCKRRTSESGKSESATATPKASSRSRARKLLAYSMGRIRRAHDIGNGADSSSYGSWTSGGSPPPRSPPPPPPPPPPGGPPGPPPPPPPPPGRGWLPSSSSPPPRSGRGACKMVPNDKVMSPRVSVQENAAQRRSSHRAATLQVAPCGPRRPRWRQGASQS